MYSLWGQPSRKKQKKEKPKATNWFEKGTVDELKQLCKAALLPVSGTKAKLVERLLTGERTSKFAYEYAAPRFSMRDFVGTSYDSDGSGPSYRKSTKTYKGARRPDGVSTEDLKDMCRKKGLVVGGKRFGLVLRLLQSETSTETGIEPKKAQGTFDETGTFQPKPRAKSMKLPDPSKLGERMRKKVNPPESQKTKWGNQKYKDHAPECVSLCNGLLQKEVIEKELFERGEETLVWQVVKELIRFWIYHDGEYGRSGFGDVVTGMGYIGYDVDCLYDTLMEFLEKTTDKEMLLELGIDELLWDLYETAHAYGHFDEAKYKEGLKKHFPKDDDEK